MNRFHERFELLLENIDFDKATLLLPLMDESGLLALFSKISEERKYLQKRTSTRTRFFEALRNWRGQRRNTPLTGTELAIMKQLKALNWEQATRAMIQIVGETGDARTAADLGLKVEHFFNADCLRKIGANFLRQLMPLHKRHGPALANLHAIDNVEHVDVFFDCVIRNGWQKDIALTPMAFLSNSRKALRRILRDIDWNHFRGSRLVTWLQSGWRGQTPDFQKLRKYVFQIWCQTIIAFAPLGLPVYVLVELANWSLPNELCDLLNSKSFGKIVDAEDVETWTPYFPMVEQVEFAQGIRDYYQAIMFPPQQPPMDFDDDDDDDVDDKIENPAKKKKTQE